MDQTVDSVLEMVLMSFPYGGVTASTWVQKHREHSGAHEDLVKNMQMLVAEDNYALAA